ncbi:hypothetical protein HaLaN_11230, partial [Haematococcus lacustris]
MSWHNHAHQTICQTVQGQATSCMHTCIQACGRRMHTCIQACGRRTKFNNKPQQVQEAWVATNVTATHHYPGLSAVGKEGGGEVPQGMECLAELYNVYEASRGSQHATLDGDCECRGPIQLTPELKKTVKAVKCVHVSLLSGKALKVKAQRSPKASHASLQQTRTPPLPSQTPTKSNTGVNPPPAVVVVNAQQAEGTSPAKYKHALLGSPAAASKA